MSARTSTTSTAGSGVTTNRWLLVVAALLLQFSIGAVYAWSVFAKALKEADAFHLSTLQSTLPFEVTIGMIFIGSYLGGRIQDRRGPRTVALIGGIIYGIGVIIAGFATSESLLWLLVLGYGVISGFGLGFAYIVPIAMLQKWFPDKRGLITGLAVGGFGFGAVLTSPVAHWLIDRNPDVPTRAFIPLGIGYLVLSALGASVFKNPPEGYTVAKARESGAANARPSAREKAEAVARDYDQGEALRTPQWYLLTAILTLNVTAGIALISQAAASATDIAGYSTAAAASAVGVLAVFNGGGRIVWAAASDYLGRMPSFAAMLGLSGVCLLLIPHTSNAALFFVLAAIVYTCYGGGFGTMPATAGDYFGVRHAGAIYGLMLIGWSLGGVVGPVIASALIGDAGDYTTAYTTIGIIALVSMALTFVTKVPRAREAATERAGRTAEAGGPA
jgi:OFA family oxalate/formate antiporter-like MFS transporter